jgi:uncharacterized iron-regulated membrane protein
MILPSYHDTKQIMEFTFYGGVICGVVLIVASLTGVVCLAISLMLRALHPHLPSSPSTERWRKQ